MESIVHCVTPVILPLHFRESLVLYNLTNSKCGLQLLSKQSSFPSYYSMKSWLQTLSLTSTIPRPLGDILIVIDNNQILKKKWAIRVNNKSYSTVVTMVVAFEQDIHGTLEFDPAMAPTNWKYNQLSPEQITTIKECDKDQSARKLQYDEHLYPFLAERIVKVAAEQKYVDDKWQDLVDEKVINDKKSRL